MNPTFAYIRGVAGENAARRFAWLVEKTAGRWHLDPLLVARVIRLESGYHVREVSSVGAVGLMQVMPTHFRHRGIPRPRWMDPATNLEVGCRVLAWYWHQMRAVYRGLDPEALLHRTLVAYNMGPRAVVSRGIYRSRYSEIVLRRYLLGSMLASPSLKPPPTEAESPVDLAATEADQGPADQGSDLDELPPESLSGGNAARPRWLPPRADTSRPAPAIGPDRAGS